MSLREKYAPRNSTHFRGNAGTVAALGSLARRGIRKFVLYGQPGVGKETLAHMVGKAAFKTTSVFDPTHPLHTTRDFTPSKGMLVLHRAQDIERSVVELANSDSESVWFFIVDRDYPLNASPFDVLDAAPLHVWPVSKEDVLTHLKEIIGLEGIKVDDLVLGLIAEDCGGRIGRALSLLETADGMDAVQYHEVVRGVRAVQDMDVASLCRTLASSTDWREMVTTMKKLSDTHLGYWKDVHGSVIAHLTDDVLMAEDLAQAAQAAEPLSHFINVNPDLDFPEKDKVAFVCGLIMAASRRKGA